MSSSPICDSGNPADRGMFLEHVVHCIAWSVLFCFLLPFSLCSGIAMDTDGYCVLSVLSALLDAIAIRTLLSLHTHRGK